MIYPNDIVYNGGMKWIYLSPHFDDAAYSCGGLIREQVWSGLEVEVWTICAGLPPAGKYSEFARELHARWGLDAEEVVASRRHEDEEAMRILGVGRRLFSVPDAIYRRHPKTNEPLYPSWLDVIGGLNPGDGAALRLLTLELAAALPKGECILAAPLTVGNHVDHLMTRAATEALSRRVVYYADYPYTRDHRDELDYLAPEGYSRRPISISEDGLTTWQTAAAAYASQISSFWEDEENLRDDIREHAKIFGGVCLWEPD